MKKLFLGLGTSLVSILPIVAISSCTIDSINFKQQELIEQANLLSDKQTMIATETASQALLNITNIETLNKYYQHVEMESGISYTFASGKINSVSNTTLDITLNVEGPTGTTPITKMIQLTGFRELTIQEKLEEQANLLINKQTLFPNGLETAQEARKIIIDQTTLDMYYSPILLSSGISYSFISASINTNEPTTINVLLKVQGQAETTPIEKEIELTGFISAQEKLLKQAQLLQNQSVLEPKQNQTPREARKAMTEDNFNEYYEPVDLGSSISYNFITSSIDKIEDTTLNVTLLVIGENGTSPITWTIKLMNFKSPDSQLQEQADLLNGMPVLNEKKGETPREAWKAMTADNFNQYYTRINLSNDYSYIFKSSLPHPTTATSLNVILTVTGEPGTTLDKTIEITRFTDPQAKLEEQAGLLITKTVLEEMQGETPREAKAIMSAGNFNQYYKPITLSHGYSYVFTGSAIHPDVKTSLNVTLTLTGEPGTTFDKTIEITGFTDPQVKLQSQANRLIGMPVLDEKKGQTPREAGTSMSVDNFNLYYKFVDLLPGYKYNFSDSEPHSDVKTTLNVTLIVIGEEDTNSIDKTIEITGFTDPQDKLQEQADLFMDKSVLDEKKGETPREAEATMNGTNFHEYYTLPTLSHGYSYTFIDPSLISNMKTSLNVLLKVTGEDGITPITKEIKITGFTDPQDKLEEQAKRLVTKPVLVGKQGETPTEAQKSMTADNFNQYYEPIALLHNYSYVFKSSLPHPTTATSLNVTLTLTGEPGTTFDKTIEITGFTDPQDKLQKQADLLITKNTQKTDMTVSQAIEVISNSNHEEYYERVEMSPGISYEFVKAIKKDETSITITFSVTGEEGTAPVTKDVVVTNFRTPTLLEVEFEKFHISLDAKTPSMKISEAITEINRALNFEKRIEAIKTVVDGFPELATEGFIYDIISGEVDPSNSQTLMLKFSIKTTSGTIEELKPILKITNLAVSTKLELEASWFSASRRGKNSETAVPIEVLAAINSAEGDEAKIASINTHSSTPLPIPSDGFTVVIGEAVVNETTPSTIDIKITISKGEDKQEVTYSITNLLGTEPEPEPEISVN